MNTAQTETSTPKKPKYTWTIATENETYKLNSENAEVYFASEYQMLEIEEKDENKIIWIPFSKIKHVTRQSKT